MPANPTTPAEQLAQWTQTLGSDQSQNAGLAIDIGRLKSQIADLTITIADVGQKVGAWGQTGPAATQQQTDYAAYIKAQTAILEAELADKAAVVKVKTDALQALADAAAAVQAAQKGANDKQQSWAAAKANTAGKQAAYDSYANLGAANASVLNDLAALRTWADRDGAAHNVSRMYFLILVMADAIQKLNVPSAADYATQLNSLALDLSTAEQDEKLAKIAADSAAADSVKAQSDSDAARSTWRQKAHDSIPGGGAAAAAAGAPAAAPAPVAAPAPPAAPAPVAAPAPPVAPAPVAAPPAPAGHQ